MTKCPNCSAIHPDGVEICFCGTNLTTVNADISDYSRLPNGISTANTSTETNQKLNSQIRFYAQGGELFGVFIINVLLTIVTLGIYYFWGKVRVRKYLYNKTEFLGERFAYHGTGKELLIGWSIAALFLGLIFALSFAAELKWKGLITEVFSTIFVYLGILILIPPAVVLSQKYRLSRTSWRGIRFSFQGGIKDFMKIYIPGVFLVIITIGIYYPYFQTDLRRYQVTNSYFGTLGFRFDGRGRELLGKYMIAIILSIFTLGIYWSWFEAFRHNYYWSHTYFSHAKFRTEITGGSLFLLKFVNLLLLIFTLGLAWPWVTTRTQRYFFNRLFLDGELDLESIEQDIKAVSATGEGISDILDIDVFGMNIGI